MDGLFLHEKASAGIIIASQISLRGYFFALFIANSVPMVVIIRLDRIIQFFFLDCPDQETVL